MFKLDDKELIKQCEADLQEAMKVKTEIDDYISKMRTIYEGTSIEKSENGSNFVSREVFKQIEWAKSQFKHPFVSNDRIVRLQSSSSRDTLFALQTEMLVNYFITKKMNRYNLFTDLLHVLLVEGTAVVRLGWEYESEEREVEVPIVNINEETGEQQILGSTTILKEVPIVNKPTAKVVKNDHIFIDPTAENVDEIQFVIHKREVTLNDLKKLDIYENLDKVEKSIEISSDDGVNTIATQYSTTVNNNLMYNLEDLNKKKVYMYEYWGYIDINDDGELEPVVIAWINGIIVRKELNPYPNGKIPYLFTQYIKEPFSIYGKSMAEILEEYQRIRTGLFRGIFDDIAQSNSTQIGVKKGNLDPINLRRFLNGENFEYNLTAGDFYQGQYNRIPSEIFALLNEIPQEMQLQSGIVPISGGQGTQAIYGSQASKTGQMNSLILKEVDTVNNIVENFLKPFVRSIAMFVYEFLEPEEIEDITNMPYVAPDNDLTNEFFDDFTIDISTQQTDDIKSSELSFLMQTLGNNIPFDITKLMMSEIARLKDMPDLAQTIMNYEPKPDPIEQERQMLELELLKAQVQKTYEEAGLKRSEQQFKMSQAEEVKAKADGTNMSNLEKKYGLDYEKQVSLLKEKYALELAKLREQMMLKQNENKNKVSINNIGIGKNKEQSPSDDDSLI